jgi:hypothetical protein
MIKQILTLNQFNLKFNPKIAVPGSKEENKLVIIKKSKNYLNLMFYYPYS